jgi:hypothetical protein
MSAEIWFEKLVVIQKWNFQRYLGKNLDVEAPPFLYIENGEKKQ